MTSELSPTMEYALKLANEKGNGKLTRFPGGFWIASETWSHPQFGTPTIEALVSRGKMTYTKWQQRDPRPAFPIEATVTK